MAARGDRSLLFESPISEGQKTWLMILNLAIGHEVKDFEVKRGV